MVKILIMQIWVDYYTHKVSNLYLTIITEKTESEEIVYQAVAVEE